MRGGEECEDTAEPPEEIGCVRVKLPGGHKGWCYLALPGHGVGVLNDNGTWGWRGHCDLTVLTNPYNRGPELTAIIQGASSDAN